MHCKLIHKVHKSIDVHKSDCDKVNFKISALIALFTTTSVAETIVN